MSRPARCYIVVCDPCDAATNATVKWVPVRAYKTVATTLDAEPAFTFVMVCSELKGRYCNFD